MNWIKAIREVFDSTDNHKYEPLVYQSAKYELELALRDEKYDFALTLAKHFEFSLERKNSIKFFINKKAINIPTEMKFDQGVLNVIVSIHNFLKWKSSIFVSKFPSVEDWKKFNEYTIGISRNSYNYNPQIDLTAILDILWEQKYYALAIDFMIENQINPSLRELDFFISLKDKKILEGLERLVVQTRNVELSRRMLSGCYYVENGVVFLYIFSSENYEALQRCAHKDPSILHPPLANYLGTKHLISQCFSFDISASIIFNEAKKPENANTTLNAMSRLLAGQCRCSRSYNLRKYYLNWYIFKSEILSLKEDNIALFNLIVTTGLTPADLKLLHLELIN
ncbi:hypothetical protein ROZALSC1DRAFT_25447 [Rozella allomycis CSF55]|uniref:Uncharacterized protein n=1 Tax=Rozella allomycis (strain CSF55) TaxID=988480 RepID=A0A4P9YBS1_ROZAC|nr:hypothetical protein ROZALSC1DRAFT_25447 [Rozella allomycis CSF55]